MQRYRRMRFCSFFPYRKQILFYPPQKSLFLPRLVYTYALIRASLSSYSFNSPRSPGYEASAAAAAAAAASRANARTLASVRGAISSSVLSASESLARMTPEAKGGDPFKQKASRHIHCRAEGERDDGQMAKEVRPVRIEPTMYVGMVRESSILFESTYYSNYCTKLAFCQSVRMQPWQP